MIEKTASVHWEGQGKKGLGTISTETGALKQYPYGFASRFEDARPGTNPEEILAAAHAACFTMAFSFACDKAGLATTDVDTTASVRLSKQGEGFAIDRIALTMQATVPGIDDATFQEIAAAAKRDCPLSRALASVPEITLVATLRPKNRQLRGRPGGAWRPEHTFHSTFNAGLVPEQTSEPACSDGRRVVLHITPTGDPVLDQYRSSNVRWEQEERSRCMSQGRYAAEMTDSVLPCQPIAIRSD